MIGPNTIARAVRKILETGLNETRAIHGEDKLIRQGMLRRSAVAFSLAALFALTLLSGTLALSSSRRIQNTLCCQLQTT